MVVLDRIDFTSKLRILQYNIYCTRGTLQPAGGIQRKHGNPKSTVSRHAKPNGDGTAGTIDRHEEVLPDVSYFRRV